MTDDLPSSVTLITHPLLQHKITSIRDEQCKARECSALLRDCGMLLGYEATRSLQTETKDVETPRALMRDALIIAEPSPVVVAVMRAGLVMAEGLRDIFHVCSFGHLGLTRHVAEVDGVIRYYSNIPIYSGQRFFIVDPVIATGRTICTAVDIVREGGVPARSITVISLIGAAAGINEFANRHPMVQLFIGARDPELDNRQFVVPGVGDMGDRLFGTI